ncbi:MAG TPA: hypothetical protein VJ819_12905 [Nocardioidaceae bacterium]|jgi:hypothetical protein|nr:hypothetical protein [Nocardioidaceae bacterium]
MTDLSVRWLLALTHGRDRASERGDVPGWVLITVMTAGLVAALWAVAGDALSTMLRDALNSVSS